MTARFLITTADERTWRSDTPVLFLGEWCKLHSRRHLWEPMDSATLPYHWDDRDRLYADYLYLQELHERLLRDVAVELNERHGVDHGVRYWRTLVGAWLGFFVQALFDRWQTVRSAVERYELTGTNALVHDECSTVPNDMAEYHVLFPSDRWNHHLYSTILREFTSVPCQLVEAAAPPVPAPASAAGLKRKLRQTVLEVSGALVRPFVRDTDAFLIETYLPIRAEIAVNARLGQVPILWQTVAAPRIPAQLPVREWSIKGESRSEFESCSRSIVPRQIPTAYLEGYRQLVELSSHQPWPRRPKVIWTSSAHRSDEVFKAWAAAKTEQGVPLVIGQHGGHYGMGLWSFAETHDIAISDRYLTWGWSEPHEPKTTPVGQLKMRRPLRVRHADRSHALLVTNDLPRYSYWLYSASVGPQWLDYFKDQLAFVAELPEHIREALIVRMTSTDYGWNQAARWQEHFPTLRLDVGQSRIDALIRESRVYVATYNATTYLEAFTMDVPTVMFWNPRHWELRDSAVEELEALQTVGIFHQTPRAAAAHLAAIWDSVDDWWHSKSVLDARQRFVRRYTDMPDNLADRVAHALRSARA